VWSVPLATNKGFMQWFFSWLMANYFTTNVYFAVLLQMGFWVEKGQSVLVQMFLSWLSVSSNFLQDNITVCNIMANTSSCYFIKQ
jgi:hypothetical protein